ncbi:hypothetical protein FHR59_000221 [Xanthomonas arboricola]|nr:hypothetical protein [Xanthomonas arboricola]
MHWAQAFGSIITSKVAGLETPSFAQQTKSVFS